MAELVADYVLGRLTEWGVHRIYGYPGDGINAFLGAFDRAGGDPEFIQVRHEEMAAFMACGHAKWTGEVGVCMATSGPGAVHLLNGLYDAKLDHQPVVAIVGQQAQAALGGNYQQEIELQTLFTDVAHEYVHMATDPSQVRHLIDRAVRIALDPRTVTCVIIPNDPGSMKGVQIDLDGRMVGIRYPMDVSLVGDSKETLKALIPKLERKEDRSWREEIEDGVERWWRLIEERAMQDADPINPQRVFFELSSRLPDNCIVSADSGSAANWYARDLRFRKGMMGSLSGTLATMGPGVPYAVAAKFAHPDRPVFALIGDGAFQMNGMNELITIAKYWQRWSDPRLIVLVLNNRDLNQVTWEQRALEGDPKYEASQALPDFPYARYAELLGFTGIRVDDPDQVGSAWDEALAADRPVVYEAVTDPEMPPLPPHISFEQARHYLTALAGDPDRGAMLKESLKQKLEEFIPRR